jgi:hypothetical protein
MLWIYRLIFQKSTDDILPYQAYFANSQIGILNSLRSDFNF